MTLPSDLNLAATALAGETTPLSDLNLAAAALAATAEQTATPTHQSETEGEN